MNHPTAKKFMVLSPKAEAGTYSQCRFGSDLHLNFERINSTYPFTSIVEKIFKIQILKNRLIVQKLFYKTW